MPLCIYNTIILLHPKHTFFKFLLCRGPQHPTNSTWILLVCWFYPHFLYRCLWLQIYPRRTSPAHKNAESPSCWEGRLAHFSPPDMEYVLLKWVLSGLSESPIFEWCKPFAASFNPGSLPSRNLPEPACLLCPHGEGDGDSVSVSSICFGSVLTLDHCACPVDIREVFWKLTFTP